MSGTMVVEFIGGPKDGDTLEMDSCIRYHRVPAPPLLATSWTPTSECDAAIHAVFSYGTYAAKGKPTEFYWQGYR